MTEVEEEVLFVLDFGRSGDLGVAEGDEGDGVGVTEGGEGEYLVDCLVR